MTKSSAWGTAALAYLVVILLMHHAYIWRFFSAGWADSGDGLLYQWNFWWIKHALFGLGSWPYHCDYMFAPIGISLAFHDLTPLYGLLSVPLQGFLSLGVIYRPRLNHPRPFRSPGFQCRKPLPKPLFQLITRSRMQTIRKP